MTKLYYSDTNYNIRPPVDINPLLLRLHKNDKVLAICARQGMKDRIRKMMTEEDYIGPDLLAIGVWDIASIESEPIPRGMAVKALLESFDAVVIVGKPRVHKSYECIVKMIENVLC